MANGRIRGFTLLELLVVLFLLGLVYAVAGPMLDSGRTGIEMKSAARQVAAAMRRARSVAITEHQEAALTIEVEQRRFQISGDPRIYELPKGLDYGMFTAESEVSATQTAAIRFFPDGSSTGGRVTISVGDAKQWVDVDWLTGRVKVL